MQSNISCSRNDVEGLIKNFEAKREILKEQLLKTNKRIGQLKTVLVRKKDLGVPQRFDISMKLIADGQLASEKLKWKKEVLDLLNKWETPLNCLIAYKKFLLESKCSDNKSKFIKANICSALSSLWVKNKIHRIKNPYGRGYIYGLNEFFDIRGKLKPKYDIRLHKELGIQLTEQYQ
jgi:hypothetical protein